MIMYAARCGEHHYRPRDTASGQCHYILDQGYVRPLLGPRSRCIQLQLPSYFSTQRCLGVIKAAKLLEKGVLRPSYGTSCTQVTARAMQKEAAL